MGIMQVLRGKQRRAFDNADVTPRRTETRPQLMMLVPDAGGIATYSLHNFASAKAAELYLDSTLRGQAHKGAVLFWALNRQPLFRGAHGVEGEPLVLIRDERKPVIYSFSFADIRSAYDFIRHEMSRGLQLGQVMMYWAVPARVDIDLWGRSAIVPPEPPRLAPVGFEERLPAFADRDASEDQDEYLTEADVARAVRMMNDLAGEPADRRIFAMPAPTAETNDNAEASHTAVIDFPSASQKLQQTKHDRAALHAWTNFALAIDEALDVHVARQVRAKLAWNRLMRALIQAAAQHDRLTAEAASHRASSAISHASKDNRDSAIREETPEGLWRAHDGARWEPRDERFKGFQSPPGRF